MTDRDQNLITLFAQAEQQFDNDAFVDGVMSQIDRERRRTLLVWVALSIFIIACVAAFAVPVITAVTLATQLLPASLIDIQADWVRQLVSPVNSVAAAVALVLLGVIRFFRRVFR